jgi:hypothetical protein
MTLDEVRNLIIAEYKFEAQKRGVKPLVVRNRMLAAFLSEAQQDIASRVQPLTTYEDVTLVADTAEYAFTATNFGTPIRAEIDGDAIDLESINNLPTTGTAASGTTTRVAIFATANVYKVRVYPTPGAAATLRIWFHPDTLWYAPSGTTAQDWGSFDGSTFTGDMKVPDKFLGAIKYFVLGKFFDDIMVKYEREVSKLKSTRGDSKQNKLEYSFGL